MTTKRGVRLDRNAVEKVCECPCHKVPAKHFVPCCHEPKTAEGATLLKDCFAEASSNCVAKDYPSTGKTNNQK